jgi:hypothetical protein
LQSILSTIKNAQDEAITGLIGGELNLFDDFKARFRKRYDGNVTLEADALRNLIKNSKLIDEHNKLFAKGKVSFELGIWEHSDLSREEIVAEMTGFIRRPKAKSLYEFEYPSDVPNYVNYTQKGWVSRVMNQGMCGSCWAFSAIGAWEGQIAKKTGQLVKLSEQNLIDCNKDSEFGNWGCSGGDMKTVYDFIVNKQRGINPAVYYRYSGRGSRPCSYNPDKNVSSIVDFVEIETGNETLLMQALAHVGPLAIAVDASLETFQNYKSGVFDDPACSEYINHAVVELFNLHNSI